MRGKGIFCWAGFGWSSSGKPGPLALSKHLLDIPVKLRKTGSAESTWMSTEERERIQVLQGTLDLIVLRTLAIMGPQHAYNIASRLKQISDDSLELNQGTLYPALVRLEQQGWIKGNWSKTENNREAKYYTITKAGGKALNRETERWRRVAGLVEKLLLERP